MSFIWIVMWKGNEFIANYLDARIYWLKEPGKRLTAGIIGHFVYSSIAIIAINYVVYLLYGWNPAIVTLKGMISYSIPAVAITFLISLFLTAREFFVSWRQLAINEEKMRSEIIATKYESLKNQVNPHFLFNSLNVLTSLVYKDPDLSAKFIKELSNVYRYVLEVKDMETIDIDSELEFIRSFTFLLKIRHSEGLNVNIDISKNNGCQVAPLALQMLVENAVKHNVISKEEPLQIDIFLENGYLVVRNNLQKKESREASSSAVGLANIKARYGFLSDKPVTISDSGNMFEVKLPVLRIEE